MNRLKVEKVKSNESFTKVELENGSTIELRPFIYVRKGDVLEFAPSPHDFIRVDKIFVDPLTGEGRRVKVHPPYWKKETIFLGPHKFEVTVRERINSEDWGKVRQLEQFHYRGKAFNKIVGRRTALLAEIEGFGIVGFGILSATVAAAKPRFELLKTNFTSQMRNKLINRIARVPRIVVHPELRGIGLGALLARHLVEYAKQYWDINHYTPIMVEVIAAMTEYHRFFEEAGFVRIGYTSGYKNGIIPRYGNGSFERRVNHEYYDFMKNQKPKPYLVFPLSREIKRKIRRFCHKPSPIIWLRHPELKDPIEFENVSVRYRVRNGSTTRTDIIKEVFGVDAEHAFSYVFRNFSLQIDPGDVVLITGASGSGKSTLIGLLTSKFINSEDVEITGRIPYEIQDHIAVLNTRWNNSLPLIEQIAKQGNIREAIETLNSVGLSEAHLYIKQPNQISDGQRYRFAVAQLCDSKKPVWIADEFVSTLNPETAAIVARGLRKIAYKSGATLVLAAPHIDSFLQTLLPNKLVKLEWGGVVAIYSIKVDARQDGKLVSLVVKNNGRLPLTRVEAGLMLRDGSFSLRSDFPCLNLNESVTTSTEINVDTRRFYAVMVRTAEGVGEIFYRR